MVTAQKTLVDTFGGKQGESQVWTAKLHGIFLFEQRYMCNNRKDDFLAESAEELV
jgi:hypothetical protein